MSLEKLIRPNILNLSPYTSARDEYKGNGEVFLDANESPYESGVNRYPDPYQAAVKDKLSVIKGVAEEQIFLGNGSDEAIDLIMRIFCEPGQDNIICTDPTYGMYSVSAAINNVEVKKVPLSKDFELIPDDILQSIDQNSKVIFICSPNNPSGNLLSRAAIMSILDKFEGIVVIDEAYIDFSDEPSFTEKLADYPRMIVLQTFSKAWGLAGIRLGMAFANKEIIDLFNKVKPPYNVNVLTQSLAVEALDNKRQVDQQIKEILKERDLLKVNLSNLETVEYIYPSDSNFILVRFNDASKVFQYLLDKEIIVRNRSKVRYGDNCLRITVGTPEENKTLIDALKELES